MPSRSSAITAVSALMPGQRQTASCWAAAALRRRRSPLPAAGREARLPAGRAAAPCRSASAARIAAGGRAPPRRKPTMPATFSVPARAAALLAAAADSGSTASAVAQRPARRRPSGRRSCAPKASADRRRARRCRRRSGRPPAPRRHAAAPPARMDQIRPPPRPAGSTPVSLLASMTETSAGCRAPPSSLRQRVEIDHAVGVTGTASIGGRQSARPPAPTDARSPRPAGARAAAPCRPERRRQRQRIGLGAAGGEDDVAGSAPTSAATCSRASSISRRAARPSPCTDDGLPARSSAADHRRPRLRPQRRGRIPVEIDARRLIGVLILLVRIPEQKLANGTRQRPLQCLLLRLADHARSAGRPFRTVWRLSQKYRTVPNSYARRRSVKRAVVGSRPRQNSQ